MAEVGKRVAVIGGGNAAVDSARTAARMGAEATIVYRRQRKDMPAIKEEVDAAEKEGVRLLFLSTPHRILGDAAGRVRALEIEKTRLGDYDHSGRRKPIPTGEIVRIESDAVVLAVGETVDLDFCRASGLTLAEAGTFVVDYSLETSRPKFYAGGDVITGASNVSNAMGFGKRAARKIDEKLMGGKRFAQLFGGFDYGRTPPESPGATGRHHSAEMPAPARVKNSDEVVLGLTPDQAHDEACRCLRCDVRG
jgi:NADH-quinone oxidoreductase subunit F